jgi:phage tail-like protein
VIASQPFPNTRFRVEIDALQDTGAVEVLFPEARIVTGSRPTRARAGRKAGDSITVQYGNLIIRRGVTRSGDWYDWWNAVRASGDRSSRNTSIALLDEMGGTVRRWLFTDTVPVAYRVSDLNALGNGVLTETLELTVGGFTTAQGERIKAGAGKSRARRPSRPPLR